MAEPILQAPTPTPPAPTPSPAPAPTPTPTPTPAPAPTPPVPSPAPAPTPLAPVTYDLKPSKPGALPDAAITQVAEIAKELGLTQEGAQKLLARHESAFAAHQAARAQQADAWHDQIAADKELGGVNLPKTIDAARKGLSVLTDAERQAIADGGFQNHPILVKVLAKLGERLGEGGIGGNPGQTKTTTAHQLFPSMPNP